MAGLCRVCSGELEIDELTVVEFSEVTQEALLHAGFTPGHQLQYSSEDGKVTVTVGVRADDPFADLD